MYANSTAHEAYAHQRQSAKSIPEVCFERSQEVNALLQEAWQLKHKDAERRESNRLSQQASRERKALGVYVSPEAALRAELEATKKELQKTQEQLEYQKSENERFLKAYINSQHTLERELEERHKEAEKSLRDFLKEISDRFASLKFTLVTPIVGNKSTVVQQCNTMRQKYLDVVVWFQDHFANDLKPMAGGRRRLQRQSIPF